MDLQEVNEDSNGDSIFSLHTFGAGRDMEGVYMKKNPKSLCEDFEFVESWTDGKQTPAKQRKKQK